MILPLVSRAIASPTHFVYEDVVQLSTLGLVSTFGFAIYLGRQMTDTIEFQRSQDRWISGLILLDIALTVISFSVLHDSTGTGPACLVSGFAL
jgi:hypothetical protein